jgi:hypothetical protein
VGFVRVLGRQKIMNEQELREQIAQDIMKWTHDFEKNSVQQFIVILCADIARHGYKG